MPDQHGIAHIQVDEQGVAWIDDTKVKVIEVVLDKLAHGSSPEEMSRQFPHLSLSQIYAALTYYYDHQADLDADMERRYQQVEALQTQAKETPLRRRLRKMGQPG